MPAKIIVFCNKKGGPGKTTLAINMGATLADGAEVLVIDADPQQSSVKWSDAAPDGNPLPMVVMGYPQQKVHQAIRKVIDRYDFIIVDTPPSHLAVSTITRSALLAADLVIVPVIPSPLDIWEAMSISDLLREVNDIRESGGVDALRARVLVNKLKAKTTLGTEVKQALKNVGIPVFNTAIHEREAYKHAVLDGCSVHQIRGPGGRAASEEITNLTIEVRDIIG